MIQGLQKYFFQNTRHSMPMKNQMKLKETLMGPTQDEQICLKDSKHILFEILENRTQKDRANSCWPSKPDLAIWLAQPAGASTALPMSNLRGFQTKYIWNP